MKVKIYYLGCVVEGTFELSDVRCIVAMSGKDILETEANYVTHTVKICKSHAYLAVVTADGTYHVFSEECTAEFVK